MPWFLPLIGMGASMGLSFLSGLFGKTEPKFRVTPSLLPEVEPTVPVISDIGNKSMRSSLSYGFRGPANGSEPGLQIPVLGGTFRMGLQLINTYLETHGTMDVLYALYAIGWGEIEEPVLDDDPDNIWVGDRRLSELPGAEYEVRTGTNSQAGITPWFEFLHQMHQINRRPTEPNRLIMEMEDAVVDDDSYFAHTVTNYLTSRVSSPSAPVGTYWRSFTGADGCYLDVSGCSDWDLGSDDFTFEGYFHPDTLTAGGKYGIIGWQNSADDSGWIIQLVATSTSNGYIRIYSDIAVGGATPADNLRVVAYSSTFDATTSAFHLAVVRRGARYYFFVDGVDSTADQGGGYWDRPLSNPSNVSVAMRIGYRNTEDAALDYNWDGHMDSLRLSKGVARYTTAFTAPTTAHTQISTESYTTKGNVNRLKLHFSFPAGFYEQESAGTIGMKYVQFDIQMKPPGASAWLERLGGYYTPTGAHAGPLKAEFDLELRRIDYDNWSTSIGFTRGEKIVGDTSEATAYVLVDDTTNHQLWIYNWDGTAFSTGPDEAIEGQTSGKTADVDPDTNSHTPADPVLGQYEIRVIRVTPEDARTADHSICTWSYVDEIWMRTLQYPQIALLGLQLPSSDQTGPDLGTVSVVSKAGSRDLPNWAGGVTSRDTSNPAWFALDLMTNEYYGMGISTDRIDETTLTACATACDYDTGSGVKRCTWNGPIDSTMEAREVLRLVQRMGRFQIREDGNKFYFIPEGPESTVSHLFCSGNSGGYSYRSLISADADQVHGFKTWYWDSSDDYRRKPYLYRGPNYDETSSALNVPEETLIGCSSESEAERYSILRYQMATMLRGECELTTGVDALTVLPGDLAYIQNDCHRMSWGGRIISLSSDTFTIDRAITLDADYFGNGHGQLVIHKASDDSVASFVVHADSLGSSTSTIKCTTTPSGYALHDYFAIAHKELHPWKWRITEVRRTGRMKFALKAVHYNAEVYQHEDYSEYI